MTSGTREQRVSAAGLPEWLRPVADAAGQVSPHQLSTLGPPDGRNVRPASVLVLFGEDDEGPHLLLLERAHDMRSHPGQVAFPGGAQDSTDADPVAAALREAEEETGLDPSGVAVFGVLPQLWFPRGDFGVTPVLGWWRQPSRVYAVDPAETASVHTVTVEELVDPANRVTVRHPSGYRGPGFIVRDLLVWGFTGGLISRLFALVGWERPWDRSAVVELPDDLMVRSARDLERGEID